MNNRTDSDPAYYAELAELRRQNVMLEAENAGYLNKILSTGGVAKNV